jgi:transposase InsO family protein
MPRCACKFNFGGASAASARRAMLDWAYQRGAPLRLIAACKPTRNAFVESFNGRLRAECLGLHGFAHLDDVRAKLEYRRIDCNTVRPHGPLGNVTPDACRRQALQAATLSTPRTAPPAPAWSSGVP